MRILKRILPITVSFNGINALTNKNERKVQQYLEQLQNTDYNDLQSIFEKDMNDFEKQLQDLGLNVDLDSEDLDWMSHNDDNDIDFDVPVSRSESVKKLPPIPPKNSTAFVTYATEELKKKVSLEQKEQVEQIQLKLNNHEEVSKQDKLKLLMFEEIAIKFEDPEDNVLQKTNEKFGKGLDGKGVEITGRSMLGSDLTRGLTVKDQGSALSQIGYYLDSIWNYGCWCYFGDNMSHGRGTPINKVDHVCRALNYCYTCVRMDGRDAQKSCAPGDVSYNRPTTLDTEKKSWEISCEINNNGDDCKINTCKCETQFVKSLIQLFFDGYRFQPEFKHDLGHFNPNSCGPLPPNIRGLDSDDDFSNSRLNDFGQGNNNFLNNNYKKPQGERKCCGEYPDRKPFNSAFQGCCVRDHIGHVFNMEERMCCNDGTVKMVCPDYVDGYDD